MSHILLFVCPPADSQEDYGQEDGSHFFQHFPVLNFSVDIFRRGKLRLQLSGELHASGTFLCEWYVRVPFATTVTRERSQNSARPSPCGPDTKLFSVLSLFAWNALECERDGIDPETGRPLRTDQASE